VSAEERSILAGSRDPAQIYISHNGGAGWQHLASIPDATRINGFLETENGHGFVELLPVGESIDPPADVSLAFRADCGELLVQLPSWGWG
jgi:hypothetical protein